ncbi:MAG: DEAD/DEAH box helicase [Bacillota bacterium]
MIELRDYQEEAVRAVLRARDRGVLSQLLVLPTGSGKTVIFAELARRLSARVLVLVHREELAWQARDKFAIVWPEAETGVVKAELDELGRQVTVASVQTLARPRRLERVAAHSYDLVVTDEAHHAVAATYQAIYERFEAGERVLHLGVTATPGRTDGQGLGRVFRELVYYRSIGDMVRAGWLCPITGKRVQTGVDISEVKVRGDDFDDCCLEAVLNTRNRNELIRDTVLRLARERRVLAFAAGVSHAHTLATVFREGGLRAEAVDGETPYQLRREILAAFRGGEVDAVVNYGVLVEGYDEPATSCIVLARPTKSQPLFTQMVGRGLRPYPGKRDCLVIDVADVSRRHRLAQLPDLLGKPPEERQVAAGGRREAAGRAGGPPGEFRLGPEGQGLSVSGMNLMRFLNWLPVRGGWVLSVPRRGLVGIVSEGSGYRVLLRPPQGPVQDLGGRAMPIEWAQGIAERWVCRELAGESLQALRREVAWRDQPATDAQLAYLRGLGHVPSGPLTKGEASDMIVRLEWERRMPA